MTNSPARPPVLRVRALTFLVAVFSLCFLASTGIAFVVVDHYTRIAVTEGVDREASDLAKTLSLTMAKYLWNLDSGAVRDLAEGALGTGLLGGLEIRNEFGATVYAAVRDAPVEAPRTQEVRYEGQTAGKLLYTVSTGEADRRRSVIELPLLVSSASFLLLSLLLVVLVIERAFLSRVRALGRTLETLNRGIGPQDVGPPSPIRELHSVQKALVDQSQEIQNHVHTLEDRIADRTRELERAQGRLAHAEALRTMVTLARGLSHELNTPVAAILSCAHSLNDPLKQAYQVAAPGNLNREDLWDRALRSASPQGGRYRTALRAEWKEAGRETNSVLFDLCATEALYDFGRSLPTLGLDEDQEEALAEMLTVARMIGVVTVAAERCAGVIHSLRGQLENSGGATPTWTTWRTLIDEALETNPQTAHTAVEIRRDSSLDTPVYGVAESLEMVIGHLAANALYSAQPGGWIRFQALALEDAAELRIGDSGPAIAPDLEARVFEPYFSTKSGGLGLGLYLCRTYLDSIGGEVRYERGPVKVFSVRIPQPASHE
jgi:signal transduction histidine kinase